VVASNKKRKKGINMNIKKSLLVLFAVISVCFAQTYNICGIVTDTGTTPLSGAMVKLEKAGLTATSGADGRFTLKNSVGTREKTFQQTSQYPGVSLHNNLLRLDLPEPSVVSVGVYSIQGKLFSTVRKTVGAGTSTVPGDRIHAGMYIYRVKIDPLSPSLQRDGREVVLRGASVEDLNKTGFTSTRLTSINSVQRSASDYKVNRLTGSKSEARSATPINDVIAVTKAGFLNYRVVVYNPDTANIQIKMILCADTLKDIDGNLYQAVRIGSQVWMAENLRVTKYNDGSDIPFDTSTETWKNAKTPKYCFYDNATGTDSIKKFGALYNWYVVSPLNLKKIAPAGWHVPSDSEWTVLEKYLIANGYNWNGATDSNRIAKSLAAKTDWWTSSNAGTIGCDLTKNNRSGFSALPGGFRNYNGYFDYMVIDGYWWSATDMGENSAILWTLYFNFAYFYNVGTTASCGYSVRLVKD
jgi:uncharacterized protein (TIGR02145 family)